MNRSERRSTISARAPQRQAPRRLQWALILLTGVTAATLSEAQTSTSDPANQPPAIPFRFRRGHILLPARINGSPPLWFVLDTGYGVTTINPQHADSLA